MCVVAVHTVHLGEIMNGRMTCRRHYNVGGGSGGGGTGVAGCERPRFILCVDVNLRGASINTVAETSTRGSVVQSVNSITYTPFKGSLQNNALAPV